MTQMMQLRSWLLDARPEIWRRLIVNPRLTLEQLHTILQHSFGWTNSHLHQFHEKNGTRYAIPSPMDREFDFVASVGFGKRAPAVLDERKVILADVFDRKKKTIAYEYDFGDGWMHAIEFEQMVDPEKLTFAPETFVSKGKGAFSGNPRAAICMAGERHAPPEDCGGLYGYQRILEVKAKPASRRSEEDRELLEWLGDEWDPDRLDLAEVNQFIGRVRVKKAHAG